MILSENNKFIFIHIPRTGGSTVRALFGKPTNTTAQDDISYGHWSIDSMRNKVRDFETYYSFSIVRNPWDHVVSYYCYTRDALKKKGNPVPPFGDYVRNKYRGGYGFLWWLMDPYSRSIIVDEVIRFENLEAGLKDLCARHGVVIGDIPHLNKSADRLPYQEYYTSELKYVVANHFKIDIELFGYEF